MVSLTENCVVYVSWIGRDEYEVDILYQLSQEPRRRWEPIVVSGDRLEGCLAHLGVNAEWDVSREGAQAGVRRLPLLEIVAKSKRQSGFALTVVAQGVSGDEMVGLIGKWNDSKVGGALAGSAS